MNRPRTNTTAAPGKTPPYSWLPPLSEQRHVVFSKDALVVALKLYYAGRDQPLPSGTVEYCSIDVLPDIAVTIGIREESSGALEKVTVGPESIAAAMITYCRKINVPLPRAGQKSLLASGDSVVLVVQIHAEPSRMRIFDPIKQGRTGSEADNAADNSKK
jgi:hypothetical protein